MNIADVMIIASNEANVTAGVRANSFPPGLEPMKYKWTGSCSGLSFATRKIKHYSIILHVYFQSHNPPKPVT